MKVHLDEAKLDFCQGWSCLLFMSSVYSDGLLNILNITPGVCPLTKNTLSVLEGVSREWDLSQVVCVQVPAPHYPYFTAPSLWGLCPCPWGWCPRWWATWLALALPSKDTREMG